MAALSVEGLDLCATLVVTAAPILTLFPPTVAAQHRSPGQAAGPRRRPRYVYLRDLAGSGGEDPCHEGR